MSRIDRESRVSRNCAVSMLMRVRAVCALCQMWLSIFVVFAIVDAIDAHCASCKSTFVWCGYAFFLHFTYLASGFHCKRDAFKVRAHKRPQWSTQPKNVHSFVWRLSRVFNSSVVSLSSISYIFIVVFYGLDCGFCFPHIRRHILSSRSHDKRQTI